MNILKKSWPFILLAILAFTIHLAFLSYPSQVVFDEVHFGKFVSAYFTGQYYFDIHPPLGKLMIAGWAWLNHVTPNFDFSHIGEQASPHMFFVMRFLPAFFGGLFVLAFSWLAYLVSRSKKAALVAGFLILLDNAFLVQSKFILVDIFMLFFEILALCFFFLCQRQKSFSAKWFIFLILTAVSFGLSISVKWTGLTTIGIIGMVLLAKIFSQKLKIYLNQPGTYQNKNSPPLNLPLLKGEKKRGLAEAFICLATILIIGFSVYLIPFVIHFNLLLKSGPGDAFMSTQFQKELKYGKETVSHPLSFWQKFVELNKTMYTASAGITASHPYGSRWYSWPIDYKPVYYWNTDKTQLPAGWNANIYLIGNPILWWSAAAAMAVILFSALRRKFRKQINPAFYILILAYLANLLPFVFISRVSFLYHYLPSIMYGILIIALLLARLWPKEKRFLVIICLAIAAGFILLMPLSYGTAIPDQINQLPMYLIRLLT